MSLEAAAQKTRHHLPVTKEKLEGKAFLTSWADQDFGMYDPDVGELWRVHQVPPQLLFVPREPTCPTSLSVDGFMGPRAMWIYPLNGQEELVVVDNFCYGQPGAQRKPFHHGEARRPLGVEPLMHCMAARAILDGGTVGVCAECASMARASPHRQLGLL